jgi:hypothetical protein
MASLPGSTPPLQHFIAPTEMPLDGVPLCFMLRAIQPAESRSWEVPMKKGRLKRMNALLLGLESFC